MNGETYVNIFTFGLWNLTIDESLSERDPSGLNSAAV
jgi:hypothetical protein